jgi:hypothetical protein
MKIEAGLGTIFEEFFLQLLGCTKQFVQQAVGMIFEVMHFLGGSYNSTDLG